MRRDIYPEPRPVHVVSAPGYVDFDGEALGESEFEGDHPKTVVKAEFDGIAEYLVVPSRCVTERS